MSASTSLRMVLQRINAKHIPIFQRSFIRIWNPVNSQRIQCQLCHRFYQTGTGTVHETRKSRNYLYWFAVPISIISSVYIYDKFIPERKNKLSVTLYRKMPLKTMSRLWGQINELNLPVFLRKPIIGLYIWMFGCKIDEAVEEDLKSYRNLSEFFRRQLKPHVRPVDLDHHITSPADGKVLHYGKVESGVLEQVKGITYSLKGFLGSNCTLSDDDFQKKLLKNPANELYHCVIYLSPGDYHRFHSPALWKMNYRRHFPGELLSVSPGVARWVQGLFNFNERVVYTGEWEHGFFSMTAVGATNVGSIKIYCDNDLTTNSSFKHPEGSFYDKEFKQAIEVQKGEMFGEFNLGSTIVLVFEGPKDFEFKVDNNQRVQFGEPMGRVLTSSETV